MKVVDNFLPEEHFRLAQSLIMDYGFPWMWNDSVTKQVGQSDPKEFQNHQICTSGFKTDQ